MKKYLAILSVFLTIIFIAGTINATTVTIRPNGNLLAQWSKYNTALSNYQLVDETGLNLDYRHQNNLNSDLVYATSPAKADLYSFQDVNMDKINSVTVYYIAQATGWLFCWDCYKSFRPMISLPNKSPFYGEAILLTGNIFTNEYFKVYQQTYNTNPVTGTAWTVSDVNNLQVGMKSLTGGLVSQVFVVVDGVLAECNNGIAGSNEQCDRVDLKGQTCQSKGYFDGQLYCDSTCKFDTSECTLCGDSIVQANEECDGGVGNVTCESLGYFGTYPFGPAITCNSCHYEAYGCVRQLCISDSDGLDYAVKGTIQTQELDGTNGTLQDSCTNSRTLSELTCTTNVVPGLSTVEGNSIDCIDLGYTGCSDGACYY